MYLVKRILLLVIALLLFAVPALAVPQTIDLDTMTLEEMQALMVEMDARIAEMQAKLGLKLEAARYVLNTNTMKFHYPHCNSVQQMKAKHREETTATYDDLIQRGYVPCKNCNLR